MHIKDNLITLNFETRELAKTYAALAWELVTMYQQTENIKFTPEQALFTFLKRCADEFADLVENPPAIN